MEEWKFSKKNLQYLVLIGLGFFFFVSEGFEFFFLDIVVFVWYLVLYTFDMVVEREFFQGSDDSLVEFRLGQVFFLLEKRYYNFFWGKVVFVLRIFVKGERFRTVGMNEERRRDREIVLCD